MLEGKYFSGLCSSFSDDWHEFDAVIAGGLRIDACTTEYFHTAPDSSQVCTEKGYDGAFHVPNKMTTP